MLPLTCGVGNLPGRRYDVLAGLPIASSGSGIDPGLYRSNVFDVSAPNASSVVASSACTNSVWDEENGSFSRVWENYKAR